MGSAVSGTDGITSGLHVAKAMRCCSNMPSIREINCFGLRRSRSDFAFGAGREELLSCGTVGVSQGIGDI